VGAAIPGLAPGDRIVLWGGGIYDWFDPGTVIRAVGRLAADRPDLKLLFLGTRHPAQGGVGAGTAARARTLAADLGLLGTVVHFHDGWVPHGDRDLWMSAATVAVSAHLRHLETEFSYRTRLVDYLWCGVPVVTTTGDELAARVAASGAGSAVPAGDDEAYAAALAALLDDDGRRTAAATAARATGRELAWPHAVAPLADFCAAPHRAPDLVLDAADRELLGLRAPRRTTAPLRVRVGAALREGGPRLLLDRLRRRIVRR
jgi:glycosyltransferase involved in cell wall biosynthesis